MQSLSDDEFFNIVIEAVESANAAEQASRSGRGQTAQSLADAIDPSLSGMLSVPDDPDMAADIAASYGITVR